MATLMTTVRLTEAEYDALATKDENTLYLIISESGGARASNGDADLSANAVTPSLMGEIKTETSSYAANAAQSATSSLAAQTVATAAAQSAATSASEGGMAKSDAVAARNDAVQARTDSQALKDKTQELYDGFLAWTRTLDVGPAFGYGVTTSGNSVSITWADPQDNEYAHWAKTRLMYKIGGFPQNEEDGVVIVDNTARNQYQYTPYVFDMGSQSGYCFALFTCTAGGVWNTGSSSPRFYPNALTWATIGMMARTNTLLGNMGIQIGTVIDLPVNSMYPKMRYRLADVNYKGDFETVHEFNSDNTRDYNSIWIPNYLPCPSGSNTAEQPQFDAPELSYAATWDTLFISGKAYYKLEDGTYTQLVAGTDYAVGDDIADYAALHGFDVYTKNHNNRVNNGNNIWKESNMRQWLNASGNDWFQKQNEYDVKSGSNAYARGWLDGFDSGFLSQVMPVYNKTARNTTAVISGGGGGGYDITLDTFWLPSRTEVFGEANNSINEGRHFAFFRDVATTNAQRIQYDEGGTARGCWLRSPYASNVSIECCIDTSGASSADLATHAYAFLPAMCIA